MGATGLSSAGAARPRHDGRGELTFIKRATERRQAVEGFVRSAPRAGRGSYAGNRQPRDMGIYRLGNASRMREVSFLFPPCFVIARDGFPRRVQHRLLRQACLGCEIGKLIEGKGVRSEERRV